MRDDEKLIRGLFADWHDASVAGDLSKLLTLMDEDVLFLLAGPPPMRGKEAFAKAFREVLRKQRIEYKWETEEIQVAGGFAHCVNHLWVTVTPLGTGSPTRRTGFTLTILRKKSDGSWVLFRDANLLTPEPSVQE